MCETRRLRKKAKRLKEEVKFLKSILKSKLLPNDVVASTKAVPPISTGRSLDAVPPMSTGGK
jgi:hypothetical protein